MRVSFHPSLRVSPLSQRSGPVPPSLESQVEDVYPVPGPPVTDVCPIPLLPVLVDVLRRGRPCSVSGGEVLMRD